MGWHSMSQPAREFLCKITELGMFAGDFILGHMLLFSMLPLVLIPHIDTVHSVMLFWLRPRYVPRVKWLRIMLTFLVVKSDLLSIP